MLEDKPGPSHEVPPLRVPPVVRDPVKACGRPKGRWWVVENGFLFCWGIPPNRWQIHSGSECSAVTGAERAANLNDGMAKVTDNFPPELTKIVLVAPSPPPPTTKGKKT